jgi:hypothetical protein
MVAATLKIMGERGGGGWRRRRRRRNVERA